MTLRLGRKLRTRRALGGEAMREHARLLELERVQRRLAHLYEIGTLLTRFEHVERAALAVIELVARTIPVRSALVIFGSPDRPHRIAWEAGVAGRCAPDASAHAEAAFGYLVRATPGSLEALVRSTGSDRRFLVLPLVVPHGAIFGALQIEASSPFDEGAVQFVNAVANQLAIALDRQAAIDARQRAAERDASEQALLAEVGTAASGSLDRRESLAAVAARLVPRVADLCIIDEVDPVGGMTRLEVLFADATKQQDLAEEVRLCASRPGWTMPQSTALACGEALLFSEVTDPIADGIAHDPAHVDLLRAIGAGSMLVLPLHTPSKILGVLTLVAEERGRYTPRDLAFGEEIATRVAIAIENASLYEKARRAIQSRDELLAIVSHDLRDPLGTILMSVESLLTLGQAGEHGEMKRKNLEIIARGARRMSRLIADLMDTASIEAGHVSVSFGVLDPAAQVAEALEAAEPLASSKSLHLRRELAPQLPPISADPARLQQVLGNLLGNAIKFAPEGSTVTVRARPSRGFVLFSVEDSGPGVSSEDIPRLFDRFWQARATAKLGSGLGLFIAKGIVEAHGGRMWVESQLGRGAAFYFTIPEARHH